MVTRFAQVEQHLKAASNALIEYITSIVSREGAMYCSVKYGKYDEDLSDDPYTMEIKKLRAEKDGNVRVLVVHSDGDSGYVYLNALTISELEGIANEISKYE